VEHVGYILAGRLHTRLDDGTEADAVSGDLVHVPPGHDGWVVGDEPVVFLELMGATSCAKRA
jgi:quercetin dioxygenase-like cupin family protein